MSHTSIRTSKSIDPIWRRIWIGRIGKGLWLVFTIAYIFSFVYYHLWELQGFYFLLIGSFNLLMAGSLVLNEVRQEKYWRRIGERRSAAWHGPEPFRARNQPLETETTLQLPVMIRLSASPKFIAGLFIAIGTFLGVCFMAGIYLGAGKYFNWLIFLIGLGIFLAICLVIFSFVYFVVLRAQGQSIELTEEGVTTRYRGYKQSLRWEDIRCFAQYPQGIVNKAVNGLAFELSNEQTVVRWSQQRATLSHLKVQSNQSQKDDFNWLVGLVNAYIVKRTGLPLLDLNDVSTVPANRTEQQNDPLTPHLKLNGQQLWSFGIMGVFALALIVFSLTGNLFPTINRLHSGTASALSGMMLLGGVLILVGTITSLWSFLVAKRYWQRLQPRRSLSKKEPTRFLAQIQPAPSATPPQPGKLNIQSNRLYLFGVSFVFIAVISFLVLEAIFRQVGIYLLIIFIATLVLALLSAVMGVTLTSKRNLRRIEVWSNGMTSRIGILESQISWQDVRQFSRYRGLRLLPGRARLYIYELAGDNTVVRWHWMHSLRSIKTDPPMTADEYERWMTQLTGYIIERTGLPLLDLDEEGQGQKVGGSESSS